MVKRLLGTYILLIVLPTLLVSSVAYYLFKQSMEKEVSVSIERTVRLLNSEIDAYFTDLVRLAASVMTEDTQLDDDRNLLRILKLRASGEIAPGSMESYTQTQRINHYLDDLLNRKRDLDSVYLHTASKELFASHRSDERIALPQLEEMEARLLASGREWIVETAADKETDKEADKETIYLIRKVNDPAHQFLGSIVLSIGTDGLVGMIGGAQLPKQDIIALWNRELPVYDKTGRWENDSFGLSPARIRSLNLTFAEGSTLVTYASPMQSEWSLVAYLPYRALTENIRTVRFWMLAAGALCVLISILAAFLLALGIVKPVQAVRNAMRKMEKGLLHTRVKVRGKDEVAELAQGFNSMSGQLQESIDRVYRSDLAHKEAELRALHAQINPHFLYNTLEAISMVAEMQRSSEAAEMARALGLLFRAATEFETLVPVRTEILLLKQYLLLQETRFDGTLRVHWEVAAEAEEAQVPKLSLQTIVENCFKHGFAPLKAPRKATIRVRAFRAEQGVSIEIVDDGVGIGNDRLHELNRLLRIGASGGEGAPVGLVNVHNRVRLLWGSPYGIELSSQPGIGTAARLNVPGERRGESE
ncbi:cache domain-containing sensor histidine kinase [Cohnella fermenti]|uniref:histidine kinase n=1 Tax=Cohnella fermenti TaxID=2565925 RepID=A0A4V3WGJ4_9BACL|nr:sensor histidine kinase [Cohnella fermenti]THF84436.1 HAMP domain-containing protein [Cohnella fermenti]